MAILTSVRDAGVFKQLREVHVRDAGAFKRSVVYERDGGDWIQIANWCIRGSGNITATPHYINAATGFDLGIDYYNLGGFGTFSNNTYPDGIQVTRTVVSCYFTTGPGNFVFMLSGTSIPNTDATFRAINCGHDSDGAGGTYLRSAATYFASKNGGTAWKWTTGHDPFFVPQGTEVFIAIAVT